MKRVATALVLAASGVLVWVAPGNAAGRIEETVECGGSTVTILVQPTHSDTNWGAVQVVGDGHLMPLAFNFTVYDVTTDTTLFSDSQVKGGGKTPGGLAAGVGTCTQSEEAPLGDLLEPGETPPPGASVTDIIRFTLTATVAQKP